MLVAEDVALKTLRVLVVLIVLLTVLNIDDNICLTSTLHYHQYFGKYIYLSYVLKLSNISKDNSGLRHEEGINGHVSVGLEEDDGSILLWPGKIADASADRSVARAVPFANLEKKLWMR